MIGLAVDEIGDRRRSSPAPAPTTRATRSTSPSARPSWARTRSCRSRPTTTSPNRRGIVRHFTEVARATDKPVLLYNIPSRTGSTCRRTCWPSWPRSTASRASSRPTTTSCGRSTASTTSTPATTTCSPTSSTSAAPAASSSPATSSATRCGAWSTSPSAAPRSTPSLRDVYEALSVTANPIPVKAALNLLGHEVGGLRLPLVEADEHELAVVRAMLERHGLLEVAASVSGTLRVLPLGGLGEIGKNMTVVEYDGRIVVVDVGLRFPTAEMVGIDLVLPDFSYLRERADDIEAIVVTHGHEDHLGALPWVLRELGEDEGPGRLRRRADDGDGALQARRAQALGDAARGARARRGGRAGPVRARARPHDALDPRLERRRADDRARHRPRHRRLQVRPDAGRRQAGRRLAPGRARPRGPAAALRRLDQRRPRRGSRRRSRAWGRTSRTSSRAARGASS